MSEEQFDEGEDYMTVDTQERLLKNKEQSSNVIVNIISNILNKRIKDYKLQNNFYVIGEDLLSALTEDDLFTKKEIDEILKTKEYLRAEGNLRTTKDYHIFVFDSDYYTEHTTLWVINSDRTMHHFDTQLHLMEEPEYRQIKIDREKRKDLSRKKLKKYFGINNYTVSNQSNHVLKQPKEDTYNCAYYCAMIINRFILLKKYDLDDNEIKNYTESDVRKFKNMIYNNIVTKTKGVVLTDEQVEKANKEIKIKTQKNKAILREWLNKQSPVEDPRRTVQAVIERNSKLEKEIKKEIEKSSKKKKVKK